MKVASASGGTVTPQLAVPSGGALRMKAVLSVYHGNQP